MPPKGQRPEKKALSLGLCRRVVLRFHMPVRRQPRGGYRQGVNLWALQLPVAVNYKPGIRPKAGLKEFVPSEYLNGYR